MLFGRVVEPVQEGRLADARRSGHEQGAPPARGRGCQQLVDTAQLGIPAHWRPHRGTAPRSMRRVESQQLGAQSADLGGWRDAELAMDRLLEPLQLTQGGPPVAPVGKLSGHGQAGLHVGGVDASEVRPPTSAPQDLDVQVVQPVPGFLEPGLVGVLGQQLARPQVRGVRGRRPLGGIRMPGPC
jgi:hypothetical protein